MKKHILSVDYTIVFTVLALIFIGFVSISSATSDTHKFRVQLFAYLLGIASMLAITFWDYRSIVRSANHIYLLSMLLLFSVFIFGVGKEKTGAVSWIRFASIGIQPSEFAKVLFCLYLSCKLPGLQENGDINNIKKLFKFILHCFPFIALVIFQNDTGTALVFVFILSVCLFLAGIRKRYIALAFALLVISLPVLWLVMSEYQRDRILVFLNPSADLADSGYQVYLSKLAISSGGIRGRGYKSGAVNSLSFLPEKDTDFIFSVIGEELGLLGTLFCLILYTILIFKCFSVAQNATDAQGRYLCACVGAWIAFHVVENIGMTIGLLPVTGIPLPYLSYGGSSALATSIGVGLVLSVRRKTFILHFD